MTTEAINIYALESTSLVACAPVVIVSAWLLRRHQQPFFAEWVRGYAAAWVMILFDYANLRLGWGPLLLASASSLFVTMFYFLRAGDRIRRRSLTSPRTVVFAAVLLVGLNLLGVVSLFTLVVVSVVTLAAVTTRLGVAMLQTARQQDGASRWVAAPFFLKSTWVFAYPLLARHSLGPVGYWVDGLLHVAMGLGMLVYVLERSVVQLALVRDGTPGHAFLYLDGMGRLVEWNAGAERLFGIPSDGMVGRRPTRLRPRAGDVDDPPSEAWLQSMLRAEAGDVDVWMTRGDGRDLWCRTSSVKTGSGVGQTQFIVTVHDVTERRMVEVRMRSLMAAIEATPEGIALADAEGRVQYANPAFEKLVGLTTDEMRGRPVAEVGREPGQAGPGDTLFDAVAERRAWFGRIGGLRGGERAAVEEASLVPIRTGGPVVAGFLLRRRDITDEVALRDRLRHAQKLEAFGRLAAGVAHDFGNLMTIVAAQNDALTTPDLAVQAQVQARQANDRAVERASMLIRQLLAFSRQSAGRPRVVDLNAELRVAAGMLGRVVGEELELVVDPRARCPAVLIDPGQLEQVVVNLVVNARDAQQGRGRVVLATSDAVGAPGWLELTVTDDGPGIPSNKLTRIFEPFFTTKATGTGLGLSIVREIVEEAGGSVVVESAVGAGTTFRIRLPASPEPVSESRAPVPTGGAGKRGTVLVVEDEEDLLTAMRANLVRHGFDVLTAGSTAKGIDVAASHPGRIDLLLTDVTMPGGSGRLLAEQLLATRPGLRVLFMSGYSRDVAVREGRSGLGEFISKPFVFDELVRRIETMMPAPPHPLPQLQPRPAPGEARTTG